MAKKDTVYTGTMTDLTRLGTMNMKNRKPYRTASQKAAARSNAVRCEDGAWRSNAPVSYHTK